VSSPVADNLVWCIIPILPEPSGLRILIAENFADCAESTACYLRLLNHTVQIASDGHLALEMAGVFNPDVVLLDLALPKIDGIEVAKRLSAARHRHTPLIIAISGYGPQFVKNRTESAVFDLHLVKPFDPDYLRVVLNRFKKMLDGVTTK
jgi:CheY-like chemotaxis protein